MKSSRGEIFQKLNRALYEEGKQQPDLAAIAMDLEARWINQGCVPLLKDVETERLDPAFVADGISLASQVSYMDVPMTELSRMDAIALSAIMAAQCRSLRDELNEAKKMGMPQLILPGHMRN
jgi:hypothetical protein